MLPVRQMRTEREDGTAPMTGGGSTESRMSETDAISPAHSHTSFHFTSKGSRHDIFTMGLYEYMRSAFAPPAIWNHAMIFISASVGARYFETSVPGMAFVLYAAQSKIWIVCHSGTAPNVAERVFSTHVWAIVKGAC